MGRRADDRRPQLGVAAAGGIRPRQAHGRWRRRVLSHGLAREPATRTHGTLARYRDASDRRRSRIGDLRDVASRRVSSRGAANTRRVDLARGLPVVTADRPRLG